jgi:hypothetical protein
MSTIVLMLSTSPITLVRCLSSGVSLPSMESFNFCCSSLSYLLLFLPGDTLLPLLSFPSGDLLLPTLDFPFPCDLRGNRPFPDSYSNAMSSMLSPPLLLPLFLRSISGRSMSVMSILLQSSSSLLRGLVVTLYYSPSGFFPLTLTLWRGSFLS